MGGSGGATATLSGFRDRMRSGISAYYRRNGVADLYAYKMGLAEHLRTARMNGIDLKVELQKRQSTVLDIGSYSTTPMNDGSFMMIDTKAMVPEVIQRGNALLSEGGLVFEGHYAGLGTRLESSKPKFNMTFDDLLGGLSVFNSRIADPKYASDPTYTALAKNISAAGGIDNIRNEYSGISDATLGDMIIIGKAFTVYQAARDRGYSVEDAMRSVRQLRFKIIVNQDSGTAIVDSFLRNSFYGLDPANVLFMAQAKHPVLEVTENGMLAEDAERSSQGNHGLIPFQSLLDGQWFHFRKNDGYSTEEKHLSGVDFSSWLKTQSVELVGSIEDTAQLLSPINTGYIGLVSQYGSRDGISFFMKMVGQKKDNPQKGGFLASINGRNAVLETDTTPWIKNTEIEYLNENKNAIFNPIRALVSIYQSEMIDNLHPTFVLHGWTPEGEPILRIEPKVPQGDRNLYLNSMYLQFLPKEEIANLKDPVDIIPTMQKMKLFLGNAEYVEFARNALGISLLR